MTIRILNPLDWKQVLPGEWIEFNGDHRRTLKVELNCEAETRVDLVYDDADGVEQRMFLARVLGLEVIEVVAEANARFDFSGGGETWFWTNDGQANSVAIPEEATFTKLMGRKTRSDQLEIMLRLQQEGYERLLRDQENERLALEAELAEREDSPSADGGTPPSVQSEPAPAPAGEGEGESTSETPTAATVSA